MKQKTLVTAVIIVGSLIFGLILMVLPVNAAMDHIKEHPTTKQTADSSSIDKSYAKKLDAIAKNIEKAISLLEAGNKEAAMTELKKTVNLTKNSRLASGSNTKEFANTQCPIMGGKIVAEKVDESLTREFEGEKIAFCCGGCPAQWDELTEAQKKQKLSGSPQKKTEQIHSDRCG